MFAIIYKKLKKCGIDVYSIGQEADTTKPHVYIKEYTLGDITGTQFGNYIVEIFVNYPIGQYSKFNSFLSEVVECLNSVNDLKRSFSSSPINIDDELGIYTTSVTYTQKRKVR